jgi:hypothetical protein
MAFPRRNKLMPLWEVLVTAAVRCLVVGSDDRHEATRRQLPRGDDDSWARESIFSIMLPRVGSLVPSNAPAAVAFTGSGPRASPGLHEEAQGGGGDCGKRWP